MQSLGRPARTAQRCRACEKRFYAKVLEPKRKRGRRLEAACLRICLRSPRLPQKPQADLQPPGVGAVREIPAMPSPAQRWIDRSGSALRPPAHRRTCGCSRSVKYRWLKTLNASKVNMALKRSPIGNIFDKPGVDLRLRTDIQAVDRAGTERVRPIRRWCIRSGCRCWPR